MFNNARVVIRGTAEIPSFVKSLMDQPCHGFRQPVLRNQNTQNFLSIPPDQEVVRMVDIVSGHILIRFEF